VETRRTIHYSGNTVIPPHPSRKNLEKRHAGNHLKDVTNQPEDNQKLMSNIGEKICATLECTWCATSFEDYSIRCRVCGNCQYCGMFCPNTNECTNCGNILPEEFRRVDERRVVRFE
jgi:hypothetical protein